MKYINILCGHSMYRETNVFKLFMACSYFHVVQMVILMLFQLQVFDSNKDGRLQLSEMAK